MTLMPVCFSARLKVNLILLHLGEQRHQKSVYNRFPCDCLVQPKQQHMSVWTRPLVLLSVVPLNKGRSRSQVVLQLPPKLSLPPWLPSHPEFFNSLYQTSVRCWHHKTFTTTSCGHTSVICLFLVTRCYWAQSVQKDKIWKENHQPLHLSFTTKEDFKVWHQNYVFENSGFNQTVGRRGNMLWMITLTTVSVLF